MQIDDICGDITILRHCCGYFCKKNTAMKIIYLLLLLLPASSALSQNYYPFIQYGTYRDEFWAPELTICTFAYGNTYWFRGDTLVNGQTYQIVYGAAIHGDQNTPFCSPYTVDTTDYWPFTLMREEPATQRVFRFEFGTDAEYLMYDFSVEAGDSVTVGYPPETCYVDSVGQETWADGSVRRLYYLTTPVNGPTRWAESLGCLNGIWNPLSVPCICPHGYCYKSGGAALYGTVCAEAVVAVETPVEKKALVDLQPNPASDFVRLAAQTEPTDFERFVLLDVSGKTVLDQYFSGQPAPIEVDVRRVKPGFYIAMIWGRGTFLGSRYLVKI